MDALQDNLIHFHWQDVISDTEVMVHKLFRSFKRHNYEGLPWWSSGLDSAFSMQGAQVQSLVREHTTCRN